MTYQSRLADGGPEPGERRPDRISKWLGWFGRRRLFWIVFALALLFYSQYQFWNQPSQGDRANWDYFAQVIARGGVPYRDVVNIKSPLSAYIGAAALIAARPFGLRDIFAIRIMFTALSAFVVAFTFLVALDAFESVETALLAAAIVLSFDFFSRNNGGIEPKTPMVLFGLMSLWAVLKDRPFAGGVFGMLSALSWQPGLLFVGAAGLGFSRYLTRWRDMKAARVLAGAILPLAVLLTYFLFAGALKDFYHWTIDFTSTVYAPRELRSVSGFYERLLRMIGGRYYRSQVYFYLAMAGLCIALVREIHGGVKSGIRHLIDRAPKHALLIAPLVYFGFCLIDIQGPVDLIPLIPFVAMFSALALAYAAERIAGRLAQSAENPRARPIRRFAMGLVIVWSLFFSVRDALMFDCDFPTLKDQDALVSEIVSQLDTGDKVFVHGQAEILVLGGLTNASKYFFLDRGKDGYLDRLEPGGFAGWFERLKAERPKIVALSRLVAVDHAQDFLDWVAESYEPRIRPIFTYYVRKPDGDDGESGSLQKD